MEKIVAVPYGTGSSFATTRWRLIADTRREAIWSGKRSATKKGRSEGKGMKMAGLRNATMATTLLSSDLISLELSRAFLNGFASLFVLNGNQQQK